MVSEKTLEYFLHSVVCISFRSELWVINIKANQVKLKSIDAIMKQIVFKN